MTEGNLYYDTSSGKIFILQDGFLGESIMSPRKTEEQNDAMRCEYINMKDDLNGKIGYLTYKLHVVENMYQAMKDRLDKEFDIHIDDLI